MSIDILSLGEPMLEFSQTGSTDGKGTYLPGYGGDTANFAVAAARQGASVGYITRLGDDAFGDEFIKLWTAEGIDTSYVTRDPSAFTGIYFITHDENGHKFSYYRKGSAASLMTPADIPREVIANAKVLHVSGISQAISTSAADAVFEAMDIARSNGTKISYDTNLRLKLWPLARARAVIMESISQADFCLPSFEDVTSLTGLDDPDAIVDLLLSQGAGTVALKLGSQGVLVANPQERHRLEGLRVQTVDATGAGDTFDGTFIVKILQGVPLVDAARYANVAAALSTEGYGSIAPIPRREDVEAKLGSLG